MKLKTKTPVDDLITYPGRVRTYLDNPEQNTLPHSCSLWEYNITSDWTGLGDLLEKAALSLKGGAGVKVILDLFRKLPSCGASPLSWGYSYRVQDSMIYDPSLPGEIGIIDSWKQLLKNNFAGLSSRFDLSLLRPAGTVSKGTGLQASGAAYFERIYDAINKHQANPTILTLMQLLGVLNDTMRRGGFKRGIITSSMDITNPEILNYINAPVVEIEGSHKKGYTFSAELFTRDYQHLVKPIIDSTNNESAFWGKRLESELHYNVCMGLLIKDGGTCLIGRINLGKNVPNKDLIKAFEDLTIQLIDLHYQWRKDNPKKAEMYLNAANDNQIGLDVMGLANLLSLRDITYQEFADALELYLDTYYKDEDPKIDTPALDLVDALVECYTSSTEIAVNYCREKGYSQMRALHTVEPAQSHSFETTDAEGFTTCRGIWAPFGRVVRRVSDTNENITVNHGGVEISSEVGAKLNQRVSELYFRLMETFGKPHAMSYDLWEYATEDTLRHFVFDSPLLTKYYTMTTEATEQQRFLTKTAPAIACTEERCTVCEE